MLLAAVTVRNCVLSPGPAVMPEIGTRVGVVVFSSIAAGFEIDYVALADAETLAPDPAPDRPRRLLAAARMGTTRLIDNVPIEQG